MRGSMRPPCTQLLMFAASGVLLVGLVAPAGPQHDAVSGLRIDLRHAYMPECLAEAACMSCCRDFKDR